jgi:hypothetical protein
MGFLYNGREPASRASTKVVGAFPVKMHLAIDRHGKVSGVPEKLHHPFASTRLLCPPRLRVGILFKATNIFTLELKIDLAQPPTSHPFHRPRTSIDDNGSEIFGHHLSPDGKQRFFECPIHELRALENQNTLANWSN